MQNVTCASCYMVFGTPDRFVEDRRKDGKGFTCPSGHTNYYQRGGSEEDKLRQERDCLKQQLAEKEDALKAKDVEVAAAVELQAKAEANAKRARTKLRKVEVRVHNGVCPCCNRSFANLARHMKTKHPEEAKLKVA